MSVVLDAPVRARGLWVATLSRVWVGGRAQGGALALAGGKVPLAVLIREADRTRAVDFDNAPLSRAQVESLCPGAWAGFEAACR